MYHSLIGKPSLRVVLVMGLLMGLCSLLLLAACGGEESAKGGADQEHNKKEIGSLRVENASGDSATANSGQIVGENVEGYSFDLRVLDYFTAEQYYYVIRRVEPMAQWVVFEEDAISQAGKFVVVNYSVTNTSPQTIEPVLSAQLHVKGADGRTEVYEETDDFPPPRALKDIVRDGMRLSQFIFDVPTEVEPELLAVAEEATTATGSAELEEVDLRESDPQGPRPEEILALQAEYFNMTDFERVYDLYAQESKDRVSEQVFVGAEKEAKQQGVSPTTPTSYSIPSVEIEGDRATIHVVAVEPPVEREGLHRDRVVTYAHEAELVLEDEGWRIMMQKATLRHYKCWETTGRLC